VRRWIASLCAVIMSPVALAATAAAPLSGLWDASVGVGAIQVPFQFGIAQKTGTVSGWFFNGEQRVISDSGSFEGDHLVLQFPSYGRQLDVRLNAQGELTGTYGPIAAGSSLRSYPFTARRPIPERPTRSTHVPVIEGQWLVPSESAKAGDKAWRLIVRQSGTQVSAAILRVDGDTGALTGIWRDGKFVLSHFDGARPLLIEVTPAADHTLQVLLRNSNGEDTALTAYRPADAHARGLPQAADPASHTRLKDPNEPLQFSFPDLNGHIVSNSDSRFRDKVLVIDVAGSWCPNCHDEAPFLQALYRKYHGRGLEIITLSFEEPEQFANPVRLRAFVKDFGLEYTVLLAGTLDDLHAKLPQAVNLDAYPTTFFIGRDGLVKNVHAGFAAAATGDFNLQLKKDFAATIERLLAQKSPAARVASAR
jgi:thiol-disulfide isomerase/thioredoxin